MHFGICSGSPTWQLAAVEEAVQVWWNLLELQLIFLMARCAVLPVVGFAVFLRLGELRRGVEPSNSPDDDGAGEDCSQPTDEEGFSELFPDPHL